MWLVDDLFVLLLFVCIIVYYYLCVVVREFRATILRECFEWLSIWKMLLLCV